MREDVASAIRQNVEKHLFSTGLTKGGHGKNDLQRNAKKHAKTMKQAKTFCRELDDNVAIAHQDSAVDAIVRKKGKHRPPDWRRRLNALLKALLPTHSSHYMLCYLVA